MIKFLLSLVLLALAAFVAWPYAVTYRLDNALVQNEHQALQALVDIEAVRGQVRQRLEQQIGGTDTGQNAVLQWLSDGVRRLGDGAIDRLIDLDWVRETLLAQSANARDTEPSFIRHIDFAFFESWNRFVIRLGELGKSPTFAILSLQGWNWRVTAVYQT